MHKTKVFYVEDEQALAAIVKETLEMQSFQIEFYEDGFEALLAVDNLDVDICVLDVMLPKVDGFTIGKKIRQSYSDIPILYLTAKDQTHDVVKGFNSGGNDYLKKPFSIEELIVRLDNLLSIKRSGFASEVESTPIGNYIFHPNKLILSFNGLDIKLTHRENELIKVFAAHKNSIVQKKDILKLVWGDDGYYNSRSLDVYIKKIRGYFSKDPNISILTLRSVGYRFNV